MHDVVIRSHGQSRQKIDCRINTKIVWYRDGMHFTMKKH
jgi:hypothetical protein